MKYALSGYVNINLGGTAGFKLLSQGTEIVSWAGVFLLYRCLPKYGLPLTRSKQVKGE